MISAIQQIQFERVSGRRYLEGKAGIPPLAPSKLTGSLFVAKALEANNRQ